MKVENIQGVEVVYLTVHMEDDYKFKFSRDQIDIFGCYKREKLANKSKDS